MLPADRKCGLLSEIALSAQSLAEFEQQCFAQLRPILGFDTACSVWSSHDGAVRHISAVAYSEATLLRDFPRYMSELSPKELLGFAAPRPVLDVHILAQPRRERLAVYRELLGPLNVGLFLTHVWHSRFGVFGFHFGRTGSPRPFRSVELDCLDHIVPTMKLGQALLASSECAQSASNSSSWWAVEWALSEREQETAALVARGFRNAEIAKLLRVSSNTVRNHLAAIFRKADVSTRAELVFLMMSSNHCGNRDDLPSVQPWSAPLTTRSSVVEAN